MEAFRQQLRKEMNILSESCDKEEKLKEENKKLKEENETFSKHIAEQEIEIQELKVKNTSIERLEACNHQLKEECEKLKQYQTSVYNVWSDLYWADKGGFDVSFKDISRSCDYYENEEFIKKEIVEDSEEEEDE